MRWGAPGARRGGTHLLRVCTSFPGIPPTGRTGGAPPTLLDLGAHRVPVHRMWYSRLHVGFRRREGSLGPVVRFRVRDTGGGNGLNECR